MQQYSHRSVPRAKNQQNAKRGSYMYEKPMSDVSCLPYCSCAVGCWQPKRR